MRKFLVYIIKFKEGLEMARQDKTSANDIGLMKTMGNLTPNTDALPYKLKTSDVETWMQNVFDATTANMQKQNPDANVPRVDVSLITLRAGDNFAPFILAMSKDVLQNGGRKGGKRNDREYSQFNVKDDDPSVNIKKDFYAIIKSWIFTKADIDSICNNGRHKYGISRSNSYQLRELRTPKVIPFNGNGTELVTVLVDPLRVFWMMLRDPEHPKDKNFVVEIESWKLISKSGIAEFNVTRKRRSRKDKGSINEAIAGVFAKKMRS